MALSESRKHLLDELTRTRVTLRTMQKEFGFNYKTIRKYYPNYRTSSEAYLEDNFGSITDEQWYTVKQMLDERAPISTIAEVSGVGDDLLRKLFPEAAWSKSEAGTLGGIISTYS